MEQEQNYVNYQNLEIVNQGFNFYNLEKQEEETLFIEVMLETTQDLQEQEEEIIVNTNLPIYEYGGIGNDIDEFIDALKKFVVKPKVNVCGLCEIEDDFRTEHLKFEDIKIDVGILAEKKLKYNFKEKIKKILLLQKEGDNNIQKEVDRFLELKNKISLLNKLIEKRQGDYGYGYNYGYDNNKIDDTTKITITTKEYNKKLREIEKEMKQIAEKLKIDDIGRFDYKTIQKKISYRKWLKMNKVELKQNYEEEIEEYENDDDDDEKPYENFDDYATQMFEESGGIIEVEDKD
jgi:hypothetical protein